MKFFTDKSVENDYLLIKIQDYLKMDDFSRWKEVIIDPGVYELTKGVIEYSWEKEVNILDFLKSLPANHYFSCDYPCDMYLPHTNRFIARSWERASQYCWHPQYITTVQSKFMDYWSFKEWFDKYNKLNIQGFMGLGNMCRIFHLTEFVKHALDYAFSHCKSNRVHIFGLALNNIPYANKLAKRFNIELSMDSTKWTRAVNTDLKQYYKTIGCRTKKERQEFFNWYIVELKKRGVKIE
ncbi:MAG: hypothetical protein ACFFDN_00390 [Candidatus Hodarchaeota archaeon]